MNILQIGEGITDDQEDSGIDADGKLMPLDCNRESPTSSFCQGWQRWWHRWLTQWQRTWIFSWQSLSINWWDSIALFSKQRTNQLGKSEQLGNDDPKEGVRGGRSVNLLSGHGPPGCLILSSRQLTRTRLIRSPESATEVNCPPASFSLSLRYKW